MNELVRVAALQFAPVYLDREATVARLCDLILAAGAEGANLIVAPECSVPMYPIQTPELHVEGTGLSFRDTLRSQSVEVPSPATDQLGEAAATAEACLVVGVNESVVEGHLYNSALVFDSDGSLVGVHRKTTPVLHERLYHTPGADRDLLTFGTSIGVIGVGICFENLHPLFRNSLIQRGEEIHCALWVSVPEDRHLMQVAARHHAAEGSVFVVAVGQVTQAETETKGLVAPDEDFVGGSVIVAPGGAVLAGPVEGKSTTLFADLVASEANLARQAFDLAGRDGRHDLYHLKPPPDAAASPSFTSPVDLSPESTALVVVDMQYNDASPHHGLCRAREEWLPGSTSAYSQRLEELTIPTIAQLLNYFRAHELGIIHLVLGGAKPDLSDLHPRVAYAIAGSVRREMGADIAHAYSEGDPEFEIIEPLRPRAGEQVLRKPTYGAFNSTELEGLLRRDGVASLVVVGVTTSACVETTARDAADRGFGVLLVDDGCADWDEEYHDSSLRTFRRLFGEVDRSAADVIRRLQSPRI